MADCTYNADQIIGVMREYAEKVQLLCLPEFALTGYTCSDLFLQDTLRGAEDGLAAILKASEGLNVVVLVGRLCAITVSWYNCAAVLSTNGELLGLVPKVHRPSRRIFTRSATLSPVCVSPSASSWPRQETLIGTNLLFACKQLPTALCWQPRSARTCGLPIPPSCAPRTAGATV